MLKKGDVIDIIFPSTCALYEEIAQLKNYIKNLGFKPRILLEEQTTPKKNLLCKFAQYPAKARFEQLYEALKNDQSKLVWCAKGGYGSADILPFLEKCEPIKQNKIFIGFSDLTSITNFLQKNWGWKTLCAPMALQIVNGGVNKESETELLQFLSGKKTTLEYDLEALNNYNKSPINAKIIGGCVCVFCTNFSTNFEIDFENKILFLEDIDETGERLDRFFCQIIHHILKTGKKPKALLLGNFTRDIENQVLIENINLAIQNLLGRIEEQDLKIPVFKSKDELGHSEKMRTLVLGIEAKIDELKLVINY